MKVILSLAGKDIESIKAAIEAAEEVNEGYAENGFSFNENQSVEIVGNTLVIEGERCPLLQDGFSDLLFSLKDAKVLKYQTSNKEMMWYENTLTYLKRVSSLDAAVAAIAAGATIIPLEIEEKLIKKYMSFFKYHLNLRVANATLTTKELKDLISIRRSEWFYHRYHFKS